MITVSIYMNSDISDVLEWKCCNISGLNLELIFYNDSEEEVAAPQSFALINEQERVVVDTIYPPWPQRIQPRDYASIYCNMDDATWQKYQSLSIIDGNGNELCFPIEQ